MNKDNKKILWIIGIVVLIIILMQGGKTIPSQSIYDSNTLSSCESQRNYYLSKGNLCVGPKCVKITQAIYNCEQKSTKPGDIDSDEIGKYGFVHSIYECSKYQDNLDDWNCLYSGDDCMPDSSCKSNTCIGSTCKDDCDNVYDGTKTNCGGCTNGASQACTIGTCAGTKTCSNNIWGSCVKTDSTCGGTCTDTIWTPLTSTKCSGESFKQTKCTEERDAVGTKDCTSGCTSDNDCDSGYKCSDKGKCVSEILGDFDWMILVYAGAGLLAFMLLMNIMGKKR